MIRKLLRLIGLLGLAGSIASAQNVVLTGTLQASNGLPSSNYTISFTPTQWFIVAGSGVTVNTTTFCGTSTDGTVHGYANPLQSSVVNPAFTGTLPPGNYYVEYTFYVAGAGSSYTTTLASPETVAQLTSTGELDVNPPTSGLPAGITGMKVYIGTTSGGEQYQGQTVGALGYIQSTPLVSGSGPPDANTTICTQVANDAGWPTGTGYIVSVSDPSGNTLPGYPMSWQLLGPNSTINLSNGLPYYHGVVTYPSPILASPFNHAVQSISGPLNLGNYGLSAGSITSCTLDGMLVAGSTCYPSVQSAVNAVTTLGGGTVYMPCGAYQGPVTVSSSNITLQGQGRQCTTLQPTGNSCTLTFAAGNSGNGINYNSVFDLSIANTTSTGDGVCFTGGANIPNDRFTMERVSVVGFRENLNFIGRSIWDNFTDDFFENALDANIYKNSSAVENAIKFQNGRIGGAQNYGVFWFNTNVDADQGLSFDHVNVEYNGASGTTANCAGIYLGGGGSNQGGIGSGSITNGSYFEGNCTTNPDGLGADILLTGEYAQAFDITGGNLIWSETDYGILNVALQTTGTYSGNNIPSASVDRIKVTTGNAFSNVCVGPNFFNGGGNSVTLTCKQGFSGYFADLFAHFPACSMTYFDQVIAVSDPATTTWGATVTGTGTPGSTHILAHCDGVNWTVFAN